VCACVFFILVFRERDSRREVEKWSWREGFGFGVKILPLSQKYITRACVKEVTSLL